MHLLDVSEVRDALGSTLLKLPRLATVVVRSRSSFERVVSNEDRLNMMALKSVFEQRARSIEVVADTARPIQQWAECR